MAIIFDPAFPFLTVNTDVNMGCEGVEAILNKLGHNLRQ
jgi:hypothetical protein